MNRLRNLKLRHYFNGSKLLLQQQPTPNNLMTRMLCDKSDKNNDISSLNQKYKVFRDEESPIVFDIEEERKKALEEELIEPQKNEKFSGYNLARVDWRNLKTAKSVAATAVALIHGETDVFDLKDLISVLRRESTLDIFVAKVPIEYKYVDYIVIATGKSTRHIYGVAQFVRKLYKMKRHNEPIPLLQGKGSEDWLALDLGNIALHLFEKKTRKMFDLEQLWSVGSEFDEQSQKQDDKYLQMIESHTLYLQNLKPRKFK